MDPPGDVPEAPVDASANKKSYKGGKSTKRCSCGMPWCQEINSGEIDQGARGHPFGKVGLPTGHSDDLRRWLKELRFKRAWSWSDDQLARCAAHPRSAEFKSLRLGKWHFRREMFTDTGRLD